MKDEECRNSIAPTQAVADAGRHGPWRANEMRHSAEYWQLMGLVGGTPNTVRLARSDRKTGILPVMEDSASSLSAHETTGWKPVAHTIFSLILQGIAVFDPMEIR